MRCAVLAALATAWGACAAEMATTETRDVVIYGSSPAALTAAIEAQRHGRTAVVVSPETRIGGLTTGGLGQTDIGNKSAFGGLALEFYRDVAAWYKDPANWKCERRADYLPDGQCAGTHGDESMWTFEPSAALAILERWERENGLEIVRGERLDRAKGGVTVSDGRIVSFRTLSGRTFRGKMFVDATYEGDLMAAAGVSYAVGREANATYGETISGIQRQHSTGHQMNPGVSAYVRAGDPSSGLLPGVEPDVAEPDGTGDRRVQAYCFRMCLTDDPENRIPFVKPANYNPLDYELLLRNLEAIDPKVFAENADKPDAFMPWINSRMPNRKTDTNNRTGFSTDFIGGNWDWPEASYAERERILKRHLDYQMGLMWTLANDPRVPEPIRTRVARWGTCRDEFADGLGHGWQRQLYVREARRMVGEYVMTERNCRGTAVAPRPVALGAYGMDSHNVRRYVDAQGFVRNEGNVEDYSANPPGQPFRRFGPYPIDYGALVPKRGECANLFVPVCLSASHMAFGSIRMEPVFFALGQVAGAAASLAVEGGCAVQDVPYDTLAETLRREGHVTGRAACANGSAPGKGRRIIRVAPGGSVEAALAEARAAGGPATIRLAGGVYFLDRTLRLAPEDSGLTIEGAPGASVTLSGGRRITGWTCGADGVWHAQVPKGLSFRQLRVNGERVPRCRAPNGGEFLMAGEPHPFDETKPTYSAGKGQHGEMIYDPKDLDFAAIEDCSTGEIRVFHWWVDSHLRIGSVDAARNRVAFVRPTNFYVGEMKNAGDRPCRYRVENFRELMDEPGEWFLDAKAGRIDYLPRTGEEPSSPDFIAVGARLRELVTLTADPVRDRRHVANVTFRNIRFADADADLSDEDPVNAAQGSAHIGAALVLRGAKQCRFEDCAFEALEGFAVDVRAGSRENVFSRCRFSGLGGGAVRIDGGTMDAHPSALTRGNVITDCEIGDYGLDWASACGILVKHAAENVIAHNRIHDGYYTAISIGWVWGYGDSVSRGNVVEHNLVEDIGKGLLNDMGGIYTLGLQPGGVIRNNVVRGIRSWSYGGHAIYCDEGSQGVLIENNLCYDAPDVFYIHYARELTVRNNIFALSSHCVMRGCMMEPHVSGYLHGNIFYCTQGRFRMPWEQWLNPESYAFAAKLKQYAPPRRQRDHLIADWNLFWNPNGTEEEAVRQFREGRVNEHSLWADPKFVDPENGDFGLRPDSPAFALGFEPLDVSQVGPRKAFAQDK